MREVKALLGQLSTVLANALRTDQTACLLLQLCMRDRSWILLVLSIHDGRIQLQWWCTVWVRAGCALSWCGSAQLVCQDRGQDPTDSNGIFISKIL